MMLHNAYGYGLFTGGLGLQAGGERLGLTVVPVSGGMTERQITVITDFRPDVIACTPSYALTLAEEFRARSVAPDEISLAYAVLGAEPCTEQMRREIDAGLGVRCTNIYGLSEVIGPGVSNECVEERAGSHVNEDHFLPEIVDPTSGDLLPEGAHGVLVMTTLAKEALPLFRYWTGDVTSLSYKPCACGRTLVRMGPIVGRTDDMLVIRGVNIYPTQIGAVLGRVSELSPHFGLVVTRPATLDEIEVIAEVSEEFASSTGAFGDCAKKSWISMNTLSIDPKTVCVEAHETTYCEQLDKLGFEVISILYEQVIPLGGALHCTTLDVYREGDCEDYFPRQVPAY